MGILLHRLLLSYLYPVPALSLQSSAMARMVILAMVDWLQLTELRYHLTHSPLIGTEMYISRIPITDASVKYRVPGSLLLWRVMANTGTPVMAGLRRAPNCTNRQA